MKVPVNVVIKHLINTNGKYRLPTEYNLTAHLPSLPHEQITNFLYTLQPQRVCLNINKGQSNFKLMVSNEHGDTSCTSHLGKLICIKHFFLNHPEHVQRETIDKLELQEGQDRPTSLSGVVYTQPVYPWSSHGGDLCAFVSHKTADFLNFTQELFLPVGAH